MRQFSATAATSDAGFPAITTTYSSSKRNRKHKTSAGKVLLAAIVHHHDTINELEVAPGQSSSPNQQLGLVNSKTTLSCCKKKITDNKSDKLKQDKIDEKSNSLGKSRVQVKDEIVKKGVNKQAEYISSITDTEISTSFSSSSSSSSSSPQTKTKTKAAISSCYTHENNIESKQENSSIITGGRRKFSKLFSKKKKTLANTLIANRHQSKIPPTMMNEGENSKQPIYQQEKGKERESEQQVNKQANSNNVFEEQQAFSEYDKEIFENDKQQVIEFKFDLIVKSKKSCEKETNETLTCKTRGQARKQFNCYDCDHDNQYDDHDGRHADDYDREDYDVNHNVNSDRESKLMNCKLDDNVNELVESFVLDSSDVCFMSTGKQTGNQKLANLNREFLANSSINVNAKNYASYLDEFDYLNKLFLHTLTYSFQLLEVKKRRRRNNKLGNNSSSDDEPANLFSPELNFQDLPHSNESTTIESYSIEISATLFLNKQSSKLKTTRLATDKTENLLDNISDDGQQLLGEEKICDYFIVDLLSNDETYSKQVNEFFSSEDRSNIILSFEEYLDKINCDSQNELNKSIVDIPKQTQSQQEGNNTSMMHKMDEQCSIDCVNIDEGLKLTKRIRNRLEKLLSDFNEKSRQTNTDSTISKPTIMCNKLLIIGFKLKEKIDSGSFSNRMCLIDFDPNFIEMYSIFESIFNGQALAYLKRHKLHLKRLKSKFDALISHLTTNIISNETLKIGKFNGKENEIKSNFADKSYFKDEEFVKQHHQVASQSKLIQAEWILYKQLSSALIRTLMIVHVHRLTNIMPPVINNHIVNDNNIDHKVTREYYEHFLMKENLIVLKFAQSIQRASAIRLKRRKRHLKGQLASSNVSIASNVSATTTTNDIFNNLLTSIRNNSSQKDSLHFDCYATPPITGYYSPNFYRNRHLIHGIDSPPAYNLFIRNHNRRHHHHHRSKKSINHQYYNQCSSRNNRSDHFEPMSHLKASQHNCQQQLSDPATTESSSISTSSGSQTRQIHSSELSRRRDNFVNNFSDSDSITSANLNSCSSSSFNRLQHSSLSHHNRSRHHDRNFHHHQHKSPPKQRLLRRDVELKWIAKQSSSRSIMQEQDLLHCHYHDKYNKTLQAPSHIELFDFKMSPKQRSSSVSRVPTTVARNSSQVIQIDCSPTNTDNNLSSQSLQHLEDGSSSRTLVSGGDDSTMIEVEDNTDNVSDICSIVAEPPKQLKLEEFLNQLSSIIAPSSKITGIIQDKSAQNSGRSNQNTTTFEESPTNQKEKDRFQGEANVPNNSGEDFRNLTQMACKNRGIAQQQMTTTNRFELDVDDNNIHSSNNLNPNKLDDTTQNNVQNNQNNATSNEDDEDCKSHSSILEQLSSLALESNTRLNNRNRHQQFNCIDDRKQHKLSNLDDSGEHFVLQPLDCSPTLDNPTTKSSCNRPLNFQIASKIPKTTGHLQKLLYNSSQLPSKITQSRVTVRDPSSVEERLRALSISCQAPLASSLTSSSGAFTLSTNSSCSSSSSSAENNTNEGTILSNNNSISPSTNQSGPTGEQYLYASVIRGHQNFNV